MIQYIYDAHGNAVAYIQGRFIYSMRGAAIGQLQDMHVHRLSGEYIGELYKDMIVDKHLARRANIGHSGNPGHVGVPASPGNRGIVNYGYPDVSSQLLQ